MKVQRIFALMLVFFVLSTAAVVASSIWGDFKGYNIARLVVNDKTSEFGDSDVPPLIVDGNTVLPLRAVSDALHALVKWENSNKTAYLYKPNVHLFFTTEVRKDSAIVPFGVVERGKEADFIVFAQVDNLKTSINSVKVSIVSPSGKSVVTPVVKSIAESKESFWLKVPLYGVSFDEEGTYVVKFAMKQDGASDYSVVSEKQIQSE
ncbi:Copper amine oxidase N-terminal domain-containing protein [Paenibacillus sp. yr247]|uniref:stalk domain-containing protein n=1 Tax=Paenibacillus sp. yr247 TaxID=1761880 RepID=UPI00087EA0A5|nr:stalk domain-containing protein [Paenibacillus sp. yr247]SDM93136.1 Copper amine oxidase N-terminal domain-containing protein [Paenibacillus sp. yr247]